MVEAAQALITSGLRHDLMLFSGKIFTAVYTSAQPAVSSLGDCAWGRSGLADKQVTLMYALLLAPHCGLISSTAASHLDHLSQPWLDRPAPGRSFLNYPTLHVVDFIT
jgi:hypothetical protein